MNLIRKIIVGLVGLSLALLLTMLLLNPQTIIQFAVSLDNTSGLIRLPAAILIDAIVLAIVVVLVRSGSESKTPANGLIVKAQGAIADVSVDSVRDRVLRAVRAVPDVLSAQAEIKAVRGKADIDLEVVVLRESISLPDKQREIDRALRQVVNKQLGLQLAGKPRVHIHMSDDSSVMPEPPVPLPSLVPEPVKAEAPAETPGKVEALDTMLLRPSESDSSDPPTPA